MSKSTEITLPDEFASTMQQLVAEAAKTLVPPRSGPNGTLSQPTESEALASLQERISALETATSAGFANLSATLPEACGNTVNERLQRIDDEIIALRKTESLNQRLFNSLHDELKNYRDNFLRESLQKPFIRDLIILLDDLTSIISQMKTAVNGSSTVAQWTSNLENASHALIEVLHRMEVTEIEPKERVDRALHRVMSYEPADFAEDDGRIVMRLKRGYRWHDQVLRMEEVVAKKFD